VYVWKIDKLNEELIAEGMSEHEAFKYLVASTVLYSLATIQYSTVNQFDTWAGILGTIVAIVGLFFIYKCNGGRGGKDIVIRYLSIGWVIFVRMFVLLMLPSLIVIYTLQEIYMGDIPDESTRIDLIYLTIIEIVYIAWVAKHINRVARASNA